MRPPQLPFLWKGLAVVFVLAAGVIGWGVWRSRTPEPGHGRVESVRLPERSRSEHSVVSFRAQTRQAKAGPVIHLQWDASSQPIRRASRAMLYIYDGGTPIELVLNRRVLDAGFTDYSPASDEIGFHLILDKGTPAGESVLVLLGDREGTHIRLESKR